MVFALFILFSVVSITIALWTLIKQYRKDDERRSQTKYNIPNQPNTLKPMLSSKILTKSTTYYSGASCPKCGNNRMKVCYGSRRQCSECGFVFSS